MDAELVALRVLHHNPELGAPLVDLLECLLSICPGIDEIGNMGRDLSLAHIDIGSVIGHVDVEVDPILGALTLGHLLEEEPWANLVGINRRRQVVAVLFRYLFSYCEILPGVETGRRWLLDVAERQRPDLASPAGS